MSKLALIALVGCSIAHPPADQPADAAGVAIDSTAGDPEVAPANDWRSQVLYLVIPDRFRDGDPSNNNATHCFDPNDPHRFHGGDIAGLRAHLDYLHDLGATAVWITPPNKQAGPAGQCGYHGYWIDYTDPDDGAVEPELGGPDDVTGLSADLHSHSMRFVLDMVVNHAGDTSRIPGEHPDWFHDPNTCGNLGNSDIFCPLDNHPDFAQEKPQFAA
jgi:alpha-amylase